MRAFLAVEIEPRARREVANLIGRLSREVEGVRWVPEANLHVTLRFLGEVEDAEVPVLVDEVREEIAAIEAFDATIEGLGFFPPRGNARVIWVGIGEGKESLIRIAKGVEAGLARSGFSKENRPYTPHVTIGRVKRPSPDHRHLDGGSLSPVSFPVAGVTLMESRLSPGGARYTRVARIELDES
ncbi:MAG: RNA 2',3'-cyclic phosphodiesterase [Planctomycetota bacterium]